MGTTTFSYKGTDYEFPDTWTDEQALAEIRKDTGEIEQPAPQPSYGQQLGQFVTQEIPAAVQAYRQRDVARFENIGAPTEQGEYYGTEPGTLKDIAVGIPERAMRIAGALGGTVADIAGTGASMVLQGVNRLAGGIPGKVLGIPLSAIGRVVAPTAEYLQGRYEAQTPGEQANIKTIGDLAATAGLLVAPGGTQAAGKGIQLVGKAPEAFGKRILASELKPKEALIKKGYGGNLAEKQRILMNNFSKYDIATAGNIEKMSDKAITMAQERFNNVEEILKKISPDKTMNPVQTMKEAAGKIEAPAGWSDKKTAIVNGIIEDMEKRGWDVDMPLDEFVKAKRMLDPDGRLFKEGPGLSDADSFERGIRKEMYLKMVDKISEASPEIKRLNTEAKELLDIKTITDAAAFRRMKNQQFSIGDMIIAGTGALGSVLGTGMYKPGSVAGMLSILALKKGLGQGRGAGIMMKAGRGVQAAGRGVEQAGKALSLKNIGKFEPPTNVYRENMIPFRKKIKPTLSEIGKSRIAAGAE